MCLVLCQRSLELAMDEWFSQLQRTEDEGHAHLAQLVGRRIPRGLFVLDAALFNFGLHVQLDNHLF